MDLTWKVARGGQEEVACLLIDHGADVTAQNKDGDTPLHLALTPSNQSPALSRLVLMEETPKLTGGEVEVVRMLINRGADVTAQNKDRHTPLHLALIPSTWIWSQVLTEREVEVVRMLIDHGADLTAQNKDGETPLHLASRRRQVAAGRMLIDRGADITAQNKHRETPLHLALKENCVDVARMLIDHSADVNHVMVQNEDGENPLHLASRQGHPEIAHMLIERGPDLTVQNKHGLTPIHLALSRSSSPLHHLPAVGTEWTQRRLEVARMLMEHGADIATLCNNKETPLHLASRYGEVVVSHVFIGHVAYLGADVTVQNKPGLTATHVELSRLSSPLHRLSAVGTEWTRRRLEVARMLIEHGADIAAQSNDKETPLHLASRYGEVVVSRMLMGGGADVTAQNKNGETPLHLALVPVPPEGPRPGDSTVTCGQVDVARMLIEHGTDVMAQNKDGSTPLHLASKWGQVEIVRMLIERGADVNAQNKNGLTPFRLATRGRHREVTDVLLKHASGADTGELPTPEGLPITRLAHNLGEDLPIPSHASFTTCIVADAELLQTPSPFSQPPSDDVVIPELNPHPVLFTTRRFLCSLGLSFTVVVLQLLFYWYLSLYEVSRRR
jgi:ankyrin